MRDVMTELIGRPAGSQWAAAMMGVVALLAFGPGLRSRTVPPQIAGVAPSRGVPDGFGAAGIRLFIYMSPLAPPAVRSAREGLGAPSTWPAPLVPIRDAGRASDWMPQSDAAERRAPHWQARRRREGP